MIQATISIHDDIYREVKKQSDDISLFVEEALKEFIRKKKIEKGLSSFGTWEEREQDSTDIVNELRQDKELQKGDDAEMDSWDSLDIESIAVDTGKTDGSVNHDIYIMGNHQNDFCIC
jgi:predicted CopG family antitoxin